MRFRFLTISKSIRRLLVPVAIVLGTAIATVTAQQHLTLSMERVMTSQELKDTGVSSLSPAQRSALDAWLNKYTERVIGIVATKAGGSKACSPSIESTIDGEFKGWDGETIFKLSNGQIWQQAEYDYMYSYSYSPDVTIYSTQAGCRMKVEDEEETILVKRLK